MPSRTTQPPSSDGAGGERGPQGLQGPPGPRGLVKLPRLGCDVVEIGSLAEELVEILVQGGDGHSGSLSDPAASTVPRKLLRSNKLVGMTGFEPATP